MGKSKTPAMSADEKCWRAESDARTMKEYAALQGDSARRRAAEAVLRKEVKAAQQVLGGKGK